MAWTRCCRTPCRARHPPSGDRRARRPVAPRSGPTAARWQRRASRSRRRAICAPSAPRCRAQRRPPLSAAAASTARARPARLSVKIREALNSSGNSGKEQHAQSRPPRASPGAPASGRPATAPPAAAGQSRCRTGTSRWQADRSRSPDSGWRRSRSRRDRSTIPPPERPTPLPSAIRRYSQLAQRGYGSATNQGMEFP